MKTGILIKQLRQNAKISQSNFATLIGLSGIPGKQYISNIERGICLPPINRINTIAKVLEVNPRIIYLAMKHDDLKKVKEFYEKYL